MNLLFMNFFSSKLRGFSTSSVAALALFSSGCPSSMSTDTGATEDAPAGMDAGVDAPTGLPDTPSTVDTSGLDGGVPIDVATSGCTRNTQCVIRSASCCGSCGAATSMDFTALHMDDVAAYAVAACVGSPGCPECARPDDPFLVAHCESGTCVGTDLSVSQLTECTVASDCVLGPRQCCACGLLSVPETIAYNPARGNPYALICNPDDPACPPCVPDFGPITAGCDGGHCVVYGPD